MFRWISRNKKYLAALFVILQIALIAMYMSERVDVRDSVATEYVLINIPPSDIQNPYEAPHYMSNFYDLFLGRFMKDGKPDIAASWSYLRDEINEKGNKSSLWNLRLRDGVEFHNGKALAMDDVLYSIDLAAGIIDNLSMYK